jgi:hypothetical protein
MWFQRYPVVLELSAGERERALIWLMKNHSTLDCKVEDRADGGSAVRVRDEDAAVLEALAGILDGR